MGIREEGRAEIFGERPEKPLKKVIIRRLSYMGSSNKEMVFTIFNYQEEEVRESLMVLARALTGFGFEISRVE